MKNERMISYIFILCCFVVGVVLGGNLRKPVLSSEFKESHRKKKSVKILKNSEEIGVRITAFKKEITLLNKFNGSILELDEEAFEIFETLLQTKDRGEISYACLLAARMASINPERTIKLLLQRASPQVKRACLPAVLNVWASTDPNAAREFIKSGVTGGLSREFEYRLLHALAWQDPARALRILQNSPQIPSNDHYNLTSILSSALVAMGMRGPDYIDERFWQELAGKENRHEALGELVRGLTRYDADEARRWLDQTSLKPSMRLKGYSTLLVEHKSSNTNGSLPGDYSFT